MPVGLTMEQEVWCKYKGEVQYYVADHKPISMLCKEMCCPICCAHSPWVSAHSRMMYKLVYRCPCTLQWHVIVDQDLIGKVADLGPCDNGCFFCICPCLTCDGSIKIAHVVDHRGTERLTLQKKLFCCWPCVQACSTMCVPFAFCARSMYACCRYCSEHEILVITQPVYGAWQRGDQPVPELGRLIQMLRWEPIGCCCASPTPMKYYFMANDNHGQELDDEQLIRIGMLLQLYRGLPHPCKACGCGSAQFQHPTGLPCLDLGLHTTVSWHSVQDAEKAIEGCGPDTE